MLAQHLGSYDIERCIGDGGMGSVYLGRHRTTQQRVAIKILRTELARDAEMVERFLREGRAASRIVHPGVVKILDSGVAAKGVPYLVMEYLEGQSLAEKLAACKRLSLLETLRIGQQIAAASSAAHTMQVVHRDLKPENIICLANCAPGQPQIKILDFGIALIETPADRKRLTRDGSFLGTPCYMAPEIVIDPRSASERSDAYALGVILYQMLTGEPPFTAASPSGVLFKQVGEMPPPLGQRAPDAPLALCNLVHSLLAKQPGDRPTMVGAFSTLVRIEQSLSQSLSFVKQPPQKSLLQRSIVWASPTLFAFVLMAGIAYSSRRPQVALAGSMQSQSLAVRNTPAVFVPPPEVVELPSPAMATLHDTPPSIVHFPELRMASETPETAEPEAAHSVVAPAPLSAPVPLDIAATLEAAKLALRNGQYDRAIATARKVVKDRPYDAWQLIGRAGCMKGDRPLVKESLRRIDPPHQVLVQFTCQLQRPNPLGD